jgi:hypothetical protein
LHIVRDPCFSFYFYAFLYHNAFGLFYAFLFF